MTSTAARGSVTLSVPQSQNTAPVHEFRCLYTHDVRRKQKRWQDGRAKFHTFNKRLIVYDDTLNFIGDSHWKEGRELGPGDEMTLDIGVLVQIDDLLTTTQTDLAPLFKREKKRLPAKNDALAPSSNARKVVGGSTAMSRPGNSMIQKHHSLDALLGSARGSHGRAMLPEQSPFAARRANQENGWDTGHEPKRRKIAAEPWMVTKAAKTVVKKTPLWTRTADDRSRNLERTSSRAAEPKTVTTGQRSLAVCQIVDMTSESDDVSLSNITAPSSPKPVGAAVRVGAPAPKPTNTAPRVSKRRIPAPAPIGPSPPSVSTKNGMQHIEVEQEEDTMLEVEDASPEKTPAARTKKLRFKKEQQQPMLLCQKIAPMTKPKHKETPAKKRRPNLYQTLSDLEGEDTPKDAAPVPRKKKTAVVPTMHEESIDLIMEPSSSCATFETGTSSSPGRAIGFRTQNTLQIPQELDQDFAQVGLNEDSLDPPLKLTTVRKDQKKPPALPAKASTSLKQQPFRYVHSENNIEHNDREDNTMALLGNPPPQNVAGKRKASQAEQRATKSVKKPPRQLRSKLAAAVSELDDVLEQAYVQPSPAERDQGAWTMEAMDLFEWRPPDWTERLKEKERAGYL
jgi:hypothetical protein